MFVFSQHVISPIFKHVKVDNYYLSKFLVFVSTGGIGVSIFFVLSGFLITYLIITEVIEMGKLNLKNFYIRRFLRIWPLYFTVVIFWFIIYPWAVTLINIEDPINSNFYYHLLFLSNFDVLSIYQSGNGLSAMYQDINWSVSIEEQFYLFWPMVFLLPKKYWLIIISSLLLFSIWFRMENVDLPFVNYLHTFSVLVDLVIGGIFAYLVIHSNKIKNVFIKTNTFTHSLLFLITFLVLFFGANQIFGLEGNPLARVISSFLFALIITSQALSKNHSILNLGNYKFANSLGKLSYGIYLLHPVALKILDIGCRKLNLDWKTSFWTELVMVILIFNLTWLLSYMSYILLENKFLKHKSKYQSIKSN